MRANPDDLIRQMEAVQKELEEADETAPLAEMIGEWVLAVNWMNDQINEVDPDDFKDAEDAVKALKSAISSAKGMQPVDSHGS